MSETATMDIKSQKKETINKTINLILPVNNTVTKIYFSQEDTVELIAINTDEQLDSSQIRALLEYSEMLEKTLHIKRSGSGLSIKIK